MKPVLDLEAHDPVDTDVVPDRHAELTAVRDRTCVFPWCTRPAPVGATPTTRSPHPAADRRVRAISRRLCRRHHRIKTHGGWTLHHSRTRPLPLDQPSTATSTSATPTAPSTSPATVAERPTSYRAPDPAASGAIGTPSPRLRWFRDGCCATSSTTEPSLVEEGALAPVSKPGDAQGGDPTPVEPVETHPPPCPRFRGFEAQALSAPSHLNQRECFGWLLRNLLNRRWSPLVEEGALAPVSKPPRPAQGGDPTPVEPVETPLAGRRVRRFRHDNSRGGRGRGGVGAWG